MLKNPRLFNSMSQMLPKLYGVGERGSRSSENGELYGCETGCGVPQRSWTDCRMSASSCAPRQFWAEQICAASRPSTPRMSAPSRLAPSSLASRRIAPVMTALRRSARQIGFQQDSTFDLGSGQIRALQFGGGKIGLFHGSEKKEWLLPFSHRVNRREKCRRAGDWRGADLRHTGWPG